MKYAKTILFFLRSDDKDTRYVKATKTVINSGHNNGMKILFISNFSKNYEKVKHLKATTCKY